MICGYIDPLHNAHTYMRVSPIRHFGGKNVHKRMEHLFTLQCACKHMYHPFVYVLTPKMAHRRRACKWLRIVQCVFIVDIG